MKHNSYRPQIDLDEALQDYEHHPHRWLKYLAKKYAKQGAKFTIKRGVDFLTINVGKVVTEVPGTYSTWRHIVRLEDLRDLQFYQCECDIEESDVASSCDDILDYAIAQKQRKRNRKALSVIPVVNLGVTGYGIHRKTVKVKSQTHGKLREQMAMALHERAHDRCPRAWAIVTELLGNHTKHKSWVRALALSDWDDGWKILKDKLRSG